jgi:hypothetical protein
MSSFQVQYHCTSQEFMKSILVNSYRDSVHVLEFIVKMAKSIETMSRMNDIDVDSYKSTSMCYDIYNRLKVKRF